MGIYTHSWVGKGAAVGWLGILLFCLPLASADHGANPKPTVREIIAAVPREFPPQYVLNEDGTAGGFAIEVMDAVAARADLKVTYRILDTWKEVHDALRNGEADVIPNMGITEQRRIFALFTVPVEEFNLVIFKLAGNSTIRALSDLSGRRVGTVANNVAIQIFGARTDVKLDVFETPRGALDALLGKTIDGLAYPEPVVWSLARERRVADRLDIVGQPLQTIRRAIAARKDNPQLLAALDHAVKAYVKTADFRRTYRKWQGVSGDEFALAKTVWATTGVIILVLFLWGAWKATRSSRTLKSLLFGHGGDVLETRLRRRGLGLTLIMIAAVSVAGGATLFLLYEAAFEEQRLRLVETAKSQASLMEAMARFDQEYSRDYPGGATAATLSQIKAAMSRFSGRSEFTIARRQGDTIAFILRQQAWDRYQPAPIPFDSERAEPMRRALNGQSGTVVGPDYRGVTVLAAYEPVASLGLGLVAKVDLDEIQAPFIEAALVSGAVGALIVLFGGIGFFTLGNPVVRQVLDSERRFRTIFEQAGVGVSLLDSHTGEFIRVNKRFCDMLGYSADEMTSATFQKITHPDDLQTDLDNMEKLRAGEVPGFTMEKRYFRKDGSVVWGDLTVSPTRKTGDRPGQHIAIVDDITDRKKTERLLTIQKQIDEAFLAHPDDEMFGEILHSIVAPALESRYGVFGYIDENGDVVASSMNREVREQREIPGKNIIFPRETWGDSTWTAVLHKGQTVVRNGSSTIPPEGSIAITRHIVCPIILGNIAIGIFEVANKKTDYTDDDIRLLEDVATHVAPLLHARLEANREERARKESEERYRTLVEGLGDLICRSRPDSTLLMVNQAYSQFFGMMPGALIGEKFTQFIPETSRQQVLDHLASFTPSHPTQTLEHEAIRADSQIRWFEWTNTATFDAAGKPVEFVAIGRDTTERRKTEESLAKVNTALRMISRANEALVRATTEQQLLDDVCRIIVDEGDFRFAWIAFGAPHDPNGVRVGAHYGYERGFLDKWIHSCQASERYQCGVCTAIDSGKPVVVDNVSAHPELEPWEKGAAERDYQSFASLPLRSKGQPFGTLNIYAGRPSAFDPKTVGLLTELSEDLSYGLLALREGERRKIAEAELKKTEERFEALARLSRVGVFYTDARGDCLYANERWCEIAGLREDEVLGQGWVKSLHPEDRERVQEEWYKAAKTQETFRSEYRFQRSDGSETWLIGQGAPQADREGKVVGYVGTITNITELKETQDALAQNLDDLNVVAAILQTALEPGTLQAALQNCLNVLLRKHEYAIQKKGAIFLVADQGMELELAASIGLADPIKEACTRVRFGHCLCGRAADTREIVHASHVDERHDTRYEGMLPHGHYCAPIKHGDQLLGVLNLYLEEGHERRQEEVDFIFLIANTLAGIITRKRAEEALREREERLHAVTQSTTDAIVGADAIGSIVAWNRGAEAIFGYTEEEIMGQSLSVLMPEELRAAHDSGIRRLREGEAPHLLGEMLELQGLRKNGQVFPLELTLGSWSSGEKLFFSGIIRDISGRKEAEMQLWQAQKVESLGNLAGGIAHDINNMLLPIQALTEMTLKELPTDSRAYARLDKVVDASVRAKDLVGQILAFSRKEEPKKEEVDLVPVVQEALDLLRSTLPASMEIRKTLPKRKQVAVMADSSQIHAVLMNLSSNAADALGGRTGHLDITVSTPTLDTKDFKALPNLDTSRRYVQIRVKDDGEGMDRETIGRAFDPFFTTKGVGEGTGLGLAIVHGIITKHEGAIRVRSKRGKGTTFEIYLPLIEKTGRQ